MARTLEKFLNRFGLATKGQVARANQRAFEASKSSRLVSDWITSPTHIDMDIRSGLKALRARSRDLCLNNPFGVNFVKLMRRNVFGSTGLSLQMKAKDTNNQPDKLANSKIEEAFGEWGKKGNCTADRKTSWLGVQNLCASLLVSDGEILIRKLPGFGNKHRFALQIIDPELLDVNYNEARRGGKNEIRMGVELDEWEAPVAYHFLEYESYSLVYSGYYPTIGNRVRVPASEIIHLFPVYRTGQSRGWPLLVPIMLAQKHMAAYQESEMVAARVSSCKVGVIETPTGEEYTGAENSDGTLNLDLEPGEWREVPKGTQFKSWDPQHPNTAFGEFVRAMLRSMACGVGLSYPTFTGDIERVNFSSIRAGLLEDREEWKSFQTMFIEELAEPVFEGWLATALVSGTLGLPFSKFSKFNKPKFMGRRWAWVDPLKDVEANVVAIENGLTSRTAVAAEQGRDLEEVFEEKAEEEKLAAKLKVELPKPGAAKAEKPKPDQGEEGGKDADDN